MLQISEQTLSGMAGARADEMTARIAAWLPAELPGWRAERGSQEWSELKGIVQAADAAGMLVETDFALFALLALGSSRNWRAVLAEDDVAAVMRDEAVDPPSRLMFLEDRLA